MQCGPLSISAFSHTLLVLVEQKFYERFFWERFEDTKGVSNQKA
jgi:hypothetical protein